MGHWRNKLWSLGRLFALMNHPARDMQPRWPGGHIPNNLEVRRATRAPSYSLAQNVFWTPMTIAGSLREPAAGGMTSLVGVAFAFFDVALRSFRLGLFALSLSPVSRRSRCPAPASLQCFTVAVGRSCCSRSAARRSKVSCQGQRSGTKLAHINTLCNCGDRIHADL